MDYYPVVGGAGIYCSIECARHNGDEPIRFALHEEYDHQCIGCGFDPVLFAEEQRVEWAIEHEREIQRDK